MVIDTSFINTFPSELPFIGDYDPEFNLTIRFNGFDKNVKLIKLPAIWASKVYELVGGYHRVKSEFLSLFFDEETGEIEYRFYPHIHLPYFLLLPDQDKELIVSKLKTIALEKKVI